MTRVPAGSPTGRSGVRLKQNIKPRPRRERQDAVRDLIDIVLANSLPALRASRDPDPGEEQPEVIVDFGGGRDRGARVAGGILLPDGDGGRDAFHGVHVGLFHSLQKLPRVGGERLDVAPLALGIDGVKGQAGFAGTRNARNYGELMVGNFAIDVLQVVDARAANKNRIKRTGGALRKALGRGTRDGRSQARTGKGCWIIAACRQEYLAPRPSGVQA